MIPRYSRPIMVSLWSCETRFQIWFEIEAFVCEALAELSLIPLSAAKNIREKGQNAHFDLKRIEEIERTTKHDVIAFLTHLAEIVGSDSRFIHQGITSSDILDTCFSVQLSRASDILLADLDQLLAALKKQALQHQNTVTIGRTHGIHAEPVTFGLKMAYAYAEFKRCQKRLKIAREEIATCMISGATGTFAHIDPYVQKYVASKLGLKPETISTQIIPRDRHAVFFTTLGVIGSCIERLATEIRHLQRTEVFEAEEYFSPGQKGSSAMPHKRNPVLSENLTGLARMMRAFVLPSMENIVLWHERDISHSSVERMIGPDATITLDFSLTRLTEIIENLIVYPEKMQQNLDTFGNRMYSQNILLALVQKGIARETAYEWVQRNAMKISKDNTDFLEEILQDKDIRCVLSEDEVREKCSIENHLKHTQTIFNAVFEEEG